MDFSDLLQCFIFIFYGFLLLSLFFQHHYGISLKEYYWPKIKEWLGIPECGICLASYGVFGDMAPRVLHCGHSCCGKCILKISQLVQSCRSIACPFCTKESRFSKKEKQSFFSKNRLLISEVIRSFFPFGKKHLQQCNTCHKNYSNRQASQTPRIHPDCGHTSCEDCVEKNFSQKGHVMCLTCNVEHTSYKPTDWKSKVPINYTIRDMLKQ